MQPTCRPCRRSIHPTGPAAVAAADRTSTASRSYRTRECPFGNGWHVVPAVVAGTDPLMSRADVAAAFRAGTSSVVRWEKAGKLTPIRTLGGQVRYRESEVKALYAAGIQAADGGRR